MKTILAYIGRRPYVVKLLTSAVSSTWKFVSHKCFNTCSISDYSSHSLSNYFWHVTTSTENEYLSVRLA